MSPLVIIGNSEIARMAFEYFTHDSDFEVAAFAAEAKYIAEPEFLGRPVVDFAEVEQRFPPERFDAFVAIGSGQLNRLRMRFYQEMKDKGYRLARYVSSRAFVWHNVEIGENCFILEDNTLQPFVRIGNNVTLWSGNHIGHGSSIADHVFIASHVVISGLCQVGERSFLGVNACTSEETRIAEDNFIAMGAAVTRSTEPDQVLLGNPAEPQKVGAKRFCRVKS
jgi:sugar O-acyltransferase (sialic acid O-acetyltransferase NeuD family)